jgi:hypothetical protein
MRIRVERFAEANVALDRCEVTHRWLPVQAGGEGRGDAGLALLDLLGVDPEQGVGRVAEAGGDGDRVRPYDLPGASQDSETAGSAYSIRKPEIARAITSCWICSVPSKMSKISRRRL